MPTVLTAVLTMQIVPKEKDINTKSLTPEKITIEHTLQRASTM